MKKTFALMTGLIIFSMIIGACAPQTVEVIKTVEVEKIVEVAGTPVVKEVIQTVLVPVEEEKPTQLEIFHWWTAPGEREAADAMFAALKDKYPEITVVENPVPGGGGTEHRIVLKARITAGIPPDTFQTLGGAELKDYVDSNVLQPLDDFYAAQGYADVIPAPLLKAVSIDGHPYSVPLNMHLENILYYNLKLFNELGLAAPTGYDDLMAACEAIEAAQARNVLSGSRIEGQLVGCLRT